MLKRLAYALCMRPAVRRASNRQSTFAATRQRPVLDFFSHYEARNWAAGAAYASATTNSFWPRRRRHHPDAELYRRGAVCPGEPGRQTPAVRIPGLRTRWLKAQLELLNDLPGRTAQSSTVPDVAPHSTVMIFPAAYQQPVIHAWPHLVAHRPGRATKPRCSATRSTSALTSKAPITAFRAPGKAWPVTPGLFALVPYQEKLSEYRSLKPRPVEYRLNPLEETQRMVEHVGNPEANQLDYFFFSMKTGPTACLKPLQHAPACN